MKFKINPIEIFCKGIRCKFFLMYSIPILVFVILVSTFESYYHYRLGEIITKNYIKALTLVISDVIGDHLYVKDFKEIEEHLKDIRFKGLKNILVVDPKGKIIAVKYNKNLIGKKYPQFCKIKEAGLFSKIFSKDNLLCFVSPVIENGKFLGYVLVLEDLACIEEIFSYHFHLFIIHVTVLFIIILIVSYIVSKRIQKVIAQATKYLRQIGEGNFEINYSYKSKDDISQLFEEIKKTAEHLKTTVVLKDYYKGLLNALPQAIIVVDEEGIIKEANNYVKDFLKLNPEEIIGKSLGDVCKTLNEIFITKIKRMKTPFEIKAEIKCTCKDFWANIVVNRVKDTYILLIDDVTEEVLKEQKLKELAAKDPLTGLFNKISFWAHLEEKVKEAEKTHSSFSVLVIDMDNFKEVNDNYGHDFGDKVLKKIAEVLKKSFRSKDIIARYGGDEFCVILTDVDKELAQILANRFIKNLENMKIKAPDGKEITLRASFGIASYPIEATDPRELFRIADRKMYKCKSDKCKFNK